MTRPNLIPSTKPVVLHEKLPASGPWQSGNSSLLAFAFELVLTTVDTDRARFILELSPFFEGPVVVSLGVYSRSYL
jgi:hypothetical protein